MIRFGSKWGMDLREEDVIRLMKKEFSVDVKPEQIQMDSYSKDYATVFADNNIRYHFSVKYSDVKILKMVGDMEEILEIRDNVPLGLL